MKESVKKCPRPITGFNCSVVKPNKWPNSWLKPYQSEIDKIDQRTRDGKKTFGFGKNDLNIAVYFCQLVKIWIKSAVLFVDFDGELDLQIHGTQKKDSASIGQ